MVRQTADALNMVEQVEYTLISEELPEWKRRHQLACIGGPPNACLAQLQTWCVTSSVQKKYSWESKNFLSG